MDGPSPSDTTPKLISANTEDWSRPKVTSVDRKQYADFAPKRKPMVSILFMVLDNFSSANNKRFDNVR